MLFSYLVIIMYHVYCVQCPYICFALKQLKIPFDLENYIWFGKE